MSIDPFAYPAEYEPADRIFTRPSHNESAARAEQARNLLDSAQNADHRPSFSHDAKQFNYADGVEALRDALAGQGHAMLAIRDELVDIAASLRTLAAAPTAVANVALAVTAVQETLTELGNDVCDVHTAIEDGAATVNDALGNVAEVIDRVRWWQWRRRWFNRRQRAAAVASEPAPAQEGSLAEVHQFLVEIRQDCPSWALASNEVLGRVRFYAEPHAACSTADTMLPGLCAQLDVVVEPDRQIHGLVYRCDPDPDGPEDGYVGAVFLSDATVTTNPTGGS